MPAENDRRPTSWLLVVACWCVVGLPAAWGVYRTVRNSLPLFHVGQTPASAAAR